MNKVVALEGPKRKRVVNLINSGVQIFALEWSGLGLANRQMKGFLYAVQGIGAVFVGIFLTVYLAGLSNVPEDVVYHSEPIFRTTLAILAVVLIILSLGAIVIAAISKRKN